METLPVHAPARAQAAGCFVDQLVTNGALYAVDLEQRVVRWSESARELLGSEEEVLGRRCYEVTAALDPRNAERCRPNCAVIAAARHGRAHADFEVYLPPCAGSTRGLVSVMLAQAGVAGGEPLVLHIVRPVEGGPCAHEGPGETRAMLQEVTSHLTSARAPGRGLPSPEEGSSLTLRQRDILARLAAGSSPREIAAELGVSAVTVRNHIQAAMDRLGAHTRLEAVLAATNGGLL